MEPATNTVPPPTETTTPTLTLTPKPTALPGLSVYPISIMNPSIPWLSLDTSARPGTYYYYFNISKPPFNSVLVRQAFASSVDRDVIVEMAARYGAINPKPATTFTPPLTLGRNLYGEIGFPFNPQHAIELLREAGYSDSSTFPTVTIMVNASGEIAPGGHYNIANAIADMWKQYLGVNVRVEAFANWSYYRERIASDPPEVFRLGWAADINDPDNFLREIFATGSEYNFGNYSNPQFDDLVEAASMSESPTQRQIFYIQAERILCEEDPALIPIYHLAYDIP
jgi:oligopeptide transport system substrate-binding protein